MLTFDDARRLLSLGRLSGAEQATRAALAREPLSAAGWGLLAAIASDARNHRGAIRCLKVFLSLEPTATAGWLSLAFAAYHFHEFSRALGVLERVALLDPGSSRMPLFHSMISRAARRQREIGDHPPRDFWRDCRHGRFRFLSRDLGIGRALDLYGEFAEAEVRLLTGLVKPGDVVLDIGANIGSLAVPLWRAVGSAGRVIAVEPQPEIVAYLAENLAANGFPTDHVLNVALGDHAGQIKLPVLDYDGYESFGGLSLGGQLGRDVPLTTVDALKLDRLDLLKVDVEGMEESVVNGARATIARHRPIMFLEDDPPPGRASLHALARALGYRLWRHEPPAFSPDNFRNNPVNVWDDSRAYNILALPVERPNPPVVPDLVPLD